MLPLYSSFSKAASRNYATFAAFVSTKLCRELLIITDEDSSVKNSENANSLTTCAKSVFLRFVLNIACFVELYSKPF